LDIAPRSRGAIFMDEMVNIISVHLRALYASVVIFIPRTHGVHLGTRRFFEDLMAYSIY